MLSQSVSPRRPGASRGRPNLALFQARMRAGLSRAELGDAAGITGKQVGLIERGVAKRSRAKTLEAIATALDADLFEVFPDRRLP